MKARSLLIGCTVGLLASGSALAGYGEGDMWNDFAGWTAAIAAPSELVSARYELGAGPEETVFEEHATRHHEFVGVAGPAGPIMDLNRGVASPEESLYERILRDYR